MKDYTEWIQWHNQEISRYECGVNQAVTRWVNLEHSMQWQSGTQQVDRQDSTVTNNR